MFVGVLVTVGVGVGVEVRVGVGVAQEYPGLNVKQLEQVPIYPIWLYE